MKALIIVVVITGLGFGLLYYQAYRDKKRWERIRSGKSLFGIRNTVPKLTLDGITYEALNFRTLIVWETGRANAVKSARVARSRIRREHKSGYKTAANARIFTYTRGQWKQRPYKL